MCDNDHTINVDDGLDIEECQDFCCRICDSIKFEPVTDNNGMFGSTDVWVTHYTCSTCGVHFQDPQKFSKPKDEREN